MKKNIIIEKSEGLIFSELLPGAQVRFVHSENMTFAEWKFNPNTQLPEHSHKHEQITKVISGTFELVSDDEINLLQSGDSAIIPPKAIHSGRSITSCIIVDVFYPVREDYK